ncbi:amino acid adenylation domain-containing protein [Archangium violaceum]|uniref:amino acid adenylation domain-containing protein n=1 Tax=Archangium violaceum TaxID=83451 RepID=UPI00194E39EE|nr:non-ribosomal peptide synthetase [Archangium violaceum]QRO01039.1 amino acid adenylation domain-containing protein [Archangium violaceum]
MSDALQRIAALSPEKRELLLRQLRQRGVRPGQQPIPPRPNSGQPPALSFAQQRLWFMDRMEPGSPLYNLPLALRLEGVLDVAALERAFQEVVRRHEALRTSFQEVGSEAVQIIAPSMHVPLRVEDLSALSPAEREQAARRRVAQEGNVPFDLTRGPLLRTLLLRLGEREHVLLLTLHHIVSDGWSMGVLVHEVAALYDAFSSGRPSPLPELSVQYADFAVWQRGWLQGDALEAQVSYWRQQLAGAPAVLELPTDRPRPAVQSFRGATLSRVMPRALWEGIKALSQREGVTPFMTLLAALQTVLSRYSGQEDVCVGSPIAGRTRSELEGLIGVFINTVVLRTKLSSQLTFRELLARVRATTVDAYAHQDVPFEKLVEELKPVRSLSHSPLFQVLFAFQNAPEAKADLPSLSLRPFEAETHSAKFDLGITFAETPEGLAGTLDYSTDLYDAETMERLFGHVRTLLEAAVAEPDRKVGELPLLTAQERERVLVEWNQTGAEYPRERSIGEEFEERVRERAGAVALECGEEKRTYGELEERANQIAHYLRGLGVGADERVGLCVERSAELVEWVLGIVKAGGAYVPLDPAYPRERLAGMLEDARPRVVVTEREQEGRLPLEGRVVVVREEVEQEVRRQPKTAPRSGAGPRTVAYVDFTSGSTGRPKGVLTEHRGVLRTVKGAKYAHLGPEETLLLIAPISFDASTLEVWGALLNGARLVVYPRGPVGDVEELERVVKGKGVTVLHLTAGLFTQVVDTKVEGLRGVRQVLTGGDVVSAPHVRRVLEELKVPVTACYGPTENTLFTSCHRMERVEQVGEVVAIGRPIGNTRVYVLDEGLQPVPVGVVGELYTAGEGLARGYLEEAGLTAEKFMPDPYGGEGERMYRTGDMARWRKDGVLEFVGRGDTQVKVRGFRVELGEVEGALRGMEGVREAVVVARKEEGGHKRLVAYVVGQPGRKVEAGEVRAYVKGRLPEYMVPAAVVVMEELPLTPNGKVDRKALPEPERVRGEAREYVAPRTPEEEKLAGIWGTVLGVEKVGVHDNFFELGGDSILSLQVVARATQAGLKLSPKLLFQHQTVAELARVAVVSKGARGEQGVVEGPVPLTPIQREFFEKGLKKPEHFNQAVLLEVREALDVALLEKALQHVVEHHDALRMRFERTDSGWKQLNTGRVDAVRVRRVDLSSVPELEQAAALETAVAEVQRSLNLSEGLLLRVALLELGQDKPGRLLLVGHHLVVDTVSWRVLLEDLQTAYQQLKSGAPVALPEKTTSFKRWAERLEAYARSEELDRERAYWEGALSREVRALPVDKAGGANTVESAREVKVSLGEEETRALLQEVPGAWRANVQEVLLAGLVKGLGEWTGQGRVRVEVEGHGREELFGDEVDITRTVGWFTAVYPVEVETPVGAGAGDALRAVKETLRRVPGKGLGYGLLRHLREDGGGLGRGHHAEVVFNYLGQLDGAAAQSTVLVPARESSGPMQDGAEERGHVLEVNGYVLGGRLEVSFGYSANLYDRARIESLAGKYVEALRALVEGRKTEEARRPTPVDFPLVKLGREELARVLAGRGEVEDVYPLTPMQQGMLFHMRLAPEKGVYLEQLTWNIRAQLESGALRRAWQTVVSRHAALRTAFLWEGLSEPVQVVQAKVELPWREEDWRGMEEGEQQRRLDALQREYKEKRLELTRAPLMRLTLVRLAESEYRLVWSHSHVVLDGWSLGVVLKDLFEQYEGYRRGLEVETGRAPQFSRYVEWLGRQKVEEVEGWWKQELKGFREPTPLPAGRGKVEKAGEVVEVVEEKEWLTKEETERLQGFVRKHQLTLNTLAQAAWALVLGKYAGQRDVVFGATASGRPAELEGVGEMVGLFINSLPVRVKLEERQPVVEWLRKLQEGQAELRQREFSPLVQVQSWSEVPRGAALFESLLVFENYPLDAAAKQYARGLEVEAEVVERTNYPLTVAVVPGERVLLRVSYEAARMEEGGARRVLEHWKAALEGLVDGAEGTLGAVSLLKGEEKRKVLEEWNATAVEWPREKCIHELVTEQARARPEAVAVSYEGQKLTYRELEERANKLGNHLRGLGVGPEVRVALSVERSLELVVGMLGILKAGGVYVPLEPSYPAERLAYMMRDAGVSVVLTQEHIADELPAQGELLLCLDTEWAQVEAQPAQAPESGVRAENLAYIIYTSGSTGRPKGVMLGHRGLCNTAREAGKAHGYGPESRVLQYASMSFDASVCEVFGALVAGASLVLAPKEKLLPGEALGGLLRQEGITAVTLTPSVLAQQEEEGLEGLGTIISAGEACTPELVRRWGKGRKLLNAYGPTEVTVCATITSGSVEERVTVGRAWGNVRVYVLDEAQRPVPVGVAGELYVGGEGLARGYVGRAELTAERFVPDGVSGRAGERLYRTGDKVRWAENGELEYLGRLDEQVKVRGMRVELGEVEAVLVEHPAVREAAVAQKEDAAGNKRLVGYVVPRAGEQVEVGPLRAWLEERLPEHQVPSAWVMLEALPLSTSGKVDKKALPAPDGSRSGGPELVLPRTPMEEVVAGIFSRLLGIKQVGVRDSFFELGGHSLLATQAISLIRNSLGVELALRELFDAPNVAALAERIEVANRAGRGLHVPPLKPASREASLPLSFAQQRLWFLDQLEPNTALYNIPSALRLKGELDVAALERCFEECIRRHESLRTVFQSGEQGPVQLILPTAGSPLSVVDLSALPEPQREQEARRLADEESRRPFSLSRGPLLRSTLLRLAEREHVLLLTMHHIISDGWSVGILIREVAALYEAFRSGRPSPLPELPVQYADYAVWQRGWLQGEALEAQLAYWRQHLADAPAVLELPTDRPRPATRSYRGASCVTSIPKPLADSLKDFSQREGVTLFMTLLAGFQVLLSRYSGQKDIVVGTDVANRNYAETEGLLGFFINQLVMRTRLEGNPSFREVLAQVRESALGAYAHQDLPFEELVRALNPERSLAHAPLFQVKLILQNTPVSELVLPGLELSSSVNLEQGSAKLDLTVSMGETPEGLSCVWMYSTDLFDASTIEGLAGHFQRLLEGLVSDAGQRVSALPMLSAPERHRLLVEWNDSAAPFPGDTCFHQLFEEQVVRTPDAMAVHCEPAGLSYAELNRRANQLAHHLRTFGVGPETRVGLFLERSVEAVVGLLGILKAGGAYVALDPAQAHLSERMAFMLRNAGVGIIVTQEDLADELPSQGALLVCLDADEPLLSVQPESNPDSGVTSGNIAYVIYTSGSTGQPKGVAIEHRHLSCYVASVSRRLELPPQASFASVSTLAADLGHTAIFPTLCAGGTLHLVPRDTAADAAALAAYGERHAVDCLKIVPTHLAALLSSPGAERLLPRKRLVLGGDISDWSLVEKVHALAPECAVFNHYGPTETTVGVLAHPVERGVRVPGSASVPLGRPLGNVRLYVLDAQGELVPQGVPGELFVGGASVGRGYLGRPDLTAERFVPDPFGQEPGARLYRTGDKVRWLSEGRIEFLGRVDHQLKIRGYRVELGEVEASLATYPAVEDCVVVAREDVPGDKRLVAYAVARSGMTVEPEAMRAYLKEKLPEYMVPSAFVPLEALPLTPNGKVDRKSLPAPERGRSEEDAFIAPRTDTEQLLASIWMELLRLERVGVKDDFFELGGHSLLATQVVSRIHVTFEVELAVIDLFEAPTLGALAARIDSRTPSRSVLVPLRRGGSRRPFFCVHPVSGGVLCYLELARRLHPEQPFYGLQAPPPEGLDAATSIQALAARYVEAIRTVQPEGPYLLGGWSMGGRVAFEMARLLQQRGQQVALLAIIDARGRDEQVPPSGEEATTQGLFAFADHLTRLAGSHPLAAELAAQLDLDTLRAVLEERSEPPAGLPQDGLAELRALWRVFSSNLRASWAYVPGSYAGALKLLRASDAPGNAAPEPELGWGPLAEGGVSVSVLPGDHFSVIAPPGVEHLATRLQELLEEARAGDGAGTQQRVG